MPATLSNPGSYLEPLRPQFHFTPERNWMNDPNGLVFFEGEYHLCYQYNPFGDKWGHMHWGHAVSRDLLHWEPLPIALSEHDGRTMFSGSVVVDWRNTSGFGRNGHPPLVAIYTADHGDEHREDQCLAFSNDRGRTWTQYDGNPVLDLGFKDFRDPKVFWHPPTARWIMAVALPNERQIRFYASLDLKKWALLGHFGPCGATGGIWECPDLFPLATEEAAGQEKWVLLVNLNPGGPAGGSACQYFVGTFDGQRFVPEQPSPEPLWADFGPDFYAAVTWSDVPAADGRRILLGWMSNHDYANDVPTHPWRGAMTIPRALSLRGTPGGLRLIQRPVAELETLRHAAPLRFTGGTAAPAAAGREGAKDLPCLLDVELVFAGVTPATPFAFRIHTGDGEFTSIEYDAAAGRLIVDRTRSGSAGFHANFGRRSSALLRLEGGRCVLRLLLDASSLEVFAQDGETVLTHLIFPSTVMRRFSLTAPATAGLTVDNITIHSLVAAPPGAPSGLRTSEARRTLPS